jgi:hypothetical protein
VSVLLEPDLAALIGEVRLISDFIRLGIIQASECPYNAAYSDSIHRLLELTQAFRFLQQRGQSLIKLEP